MTNKTKQSPNQNDPPLSQEQLIALDARIGANAKEWLERNLPKKTSKAERKVKSNRGPKPKTIENPFYGYIGCTTCWGRYPVFAESIIEGAARLDWHDRPIGKGGKSMPLSVRDLAVILESLPLITNEAIENLLQLEERHARRYFKAIQLIVSNLMRNRPQSLINEMDGIELKPCEWQNSNDDARLPSAEELAKLHYDLRTLTQYNSAEEHEAEINNDKYKPNTIEPLRRQQHPMKTKVIQMLLDGAVITSIERETGVCPKTIRRWRDEAAARRGLRAS